MSSPETPPGSAQEAPSAEKSAAADAGRTPHIPDKPAPRSRTERRHAKMRRHRQRIEERRNGGGFFSRYRTVLIVAAAVILAAGAGVFWWLNSRPEPFDFLESPASSETVKERLTRLGTLISNDADLAEAVETGLGYLVVTRLSEKELDLLEEGEEGSSPLEGGPASLRRVGLWLNDGVVTLARLSTDEECLMLRTSPGEDLEFAVEAQSPCDPSLASVDWRRSW